MHLTRVGFVMERQSLQQAYPMTGISSLETITTAFAPVGYTIQDMQNIVQSVRSGFLSEDTCCISAPFPSPSNNLMIVFTKSADTVRVIFPAATSY
jgi:hypothetical protein